MLRLNKLIYHELYGCLILTNGTVDLIITTSIGPRILFYGYTGGQNLFRVFDEQIGNTSVNTWQSYGGHRLWHAPEVFPRTYYPDNDPVAHEWDGRVLRLVSPVETTTGLQKVMEIELDESGTQVRLNHITHNRSVWDVEVAAWCLSVMAPGGRVIVPQEEYRPHPDCLTPARPLVLWHFTRMDDPRFVWGDRYIQLHEDASVNCKQKFGVRNSHGWAAYALNGEVFVKKYDCIAGATYPDMGCNSEFYTEPGFLEIETLSPLTRVAPNQSFAHRESWSLHTAEVSSLESHIAQIVEPLVNGHMH